MISDSPEWICSAGSHHVKPRNTLPRHHFPSRDASSPPNASPLTVEDSDLAQPTGK